MSRAFSASGSIAGVFFSQSNISVSLSAFDHCCGYDHILCCSGCTDSSGCPCLPDMRCCLDCADLRNGSVVLCCGCGAVGSALPWGGRGRRFKSGHSDQYVKTAFRYCGEPFFSCQNILTQKSSEMIGAFGFILHLRKLCKFCFQCRIDLCVKLVVFLILRYSLCFRLLYLVGLYYCLTSFRY